MNDKPTALPVVGWREWVSLPDLGIERIKAKIDTGARTSCLHAFEVKPFTEAGRQRVCFKIHPLQRDTGTVVTCCADVVARRLVSDSGGHREQRWVIASAICIGPYTWPSELTLTSREDMMFRMLLGRTALRRRAMVDPSRSYQVGKPPDRSGRNPAGGRER